MKRNIKKLLTNTNQKFLINYESVENKYYSKYSI